MYKCIVVDLKNLEKQIKVCFASKLFIETIISARDFPFLKIARLFFHQDLAIFNLFC